MPAVRKVQRPTEPVWAQATQGPLHAMLQHTPSTQNPDEQSLADSQDAPLALLPHRPATHSWPAAHMALVAQAVAQRLVAGSQA
jgi:hypothetical protein